MRARNAVLAGALGAGWLLALVWLRAGASAERRPESPVSGSAREEPSEPPRRPVEAAAASRSVRWPEVPPPAGVLRQLRAAEPRAGPRRRFGENGAVAGQVVRDGAAPVVIRAHAQDALEEEVREVVPDPDTGWFRIDGLRPGRHDLVAILGAQEEEVARAEGLLVAVGETTIHERFDPLDLRGCVRTIAIRPSCADALPVGIPWFAIRETGSVAFSPLRQADSRRSVEIWTSRPALDVLLRDKGHRDLVLFGVARDQEAVFPTAISVRLVLPEAIEAAELGWQVHVTLANEDPWLPAPARVSGRFDADGVAHLQLGVPGTFVVQPSLEKRSLGWKALPNPDAITVLDGSERQEFVLALPQGAIAAASAELAQRDRER